MPMTVDFRTKASAVGIIPGNLFRKEMGVSETEILSARLIDRTLRPLFPEGYHHESQIITTLQSYDPNHSDVDVQSINAASTALCISDIPFSGPVAAVRIARSIDGVVTVNPTQSYLDSSECSGHMLYAGVASRPIMLEGEMKEWSEQDITECMVLAHEEIQPLLAAQLELQQQCGKEKRAYTPCAPSQELNTLAHGLGYERALGVVKGANGCSKSERGDLQSEFYKWMKKELTKQLSAEAVEELPSGVLHKAAENVMKQVVRECALQTTPIRFDGRPIHQVRDILLDADVLPVVHGSSLFSRGDTQTLCTSTLGGVGDAMQLVKGLAADVAKSNGEERLVKNFFLQYEFPPYSVNETGRVGGVNRRMVGHGALAEKALNAVVPPLEVLTLTEVLDQFMATGRFKYSNVARVTSEVSGSDGSSSMATVCGATAALQDAGVPLTAPVAGVSIGLMTPASGAVWKGEGEGEGEGEEQYQLLTDILGAEDHFGDMDFKIAGTSNGVTALQLDMKQHGVPIRVLSEALDLAQTARCGILQSMDQSQPQASLAHEPKPHVERRVTFVLDDPNSQMGELIGPKGANIRLLEQKFPSVKVSTRFGTDLVEVASTDATALAGCLRHIHSMFVSLNIGTAYSGNVVRIEKYGAFVELNEASQTVLVHVSELAHGFVDDPSSVVSVGDHIDLKCFGYDKRKDRFQFSRKALIDSSGGTGGGTGGSMGGGTGGIQSTTVYKTNATKSVGTPPIANETATPVVNNIELQDNEIAAIKNLTREFAADEGLSQVDQRQLNDLLESLIDSNNSGGGSNSSSPSNHQPVATDTDQRAAVQELSDFILNNKDKQDLLENFASLSPEAADVLSKFVSVDEGGTATEDVVGSSSSTSGGDDASIQTNLPNPEPGTTYMGQVISVKSYGASVDIGNNREGFIHISELQDGNNSLKKDEIIQVKVTDVTSGGNIYLTQHVVVSSPATSSPSPTTTPDAPKEDSGETVSEGKKGSKQPPKKGPPKRDPKSKRHKKRQERKQRYIKTRQMRLQLAHEIRKQAKFDEKWVVGSAKNEDTSKISKTQFQKVSEEKTTKKDPAQSKNGIRGFFSSLFGGNK